MSTQSRKLTFYRQARADGGIRTGIELDEDTIFERFEKGGREADPTLLWYVELRCKGRGLPAEPQEARRWLLDHEKLIVEGFSRCAAEFEAGRDIELYPLIWSKFHDTPKNTEMAIACATKNRPWALSIPRILGDIGSHWRERIEQLQPAE